MPKARKSRFGSVALKKIEKQVRNDVARFHLYASKRSGHGVVSGTNHRGKPIMDNNIGQTRSEKLASSAMDTSKTNKRDNVTNDTQWGDNVSSLLVDQTPIKDSNTRHMSSSTMIARKNNRTNDGSLATPLGMGNKRGVAVEANREVNHASRPMKQDPPRKNTNTKQVDAIMPNGNLTPLERSSDSCQSITPLSNEMRQPTTSSLITRRDDSIKVLRSLEDHDPMKAKTSMNISKHINNSESPQFKPMAGLVPITKNVDGSDGYNDALPSRLKRQVSLDNGGGFIVDNHSDRNLTIKETEEASPKRMRKQRNKESKGDDTSDRNPMGEINGDAYRYGVKDYYSERNLTYGLMKRQRGSRKTNEGEAIDKGDILIEVEDGGTQSETHDHRLKNDEKQRVIELNEVGDGEDDDSCTMKNFESLPKDHVSLDCSNEAIKPEKLTHRKLKKWKQYIMRNDDEDLHGRGGDHSHMDADDDSSRLTSQAPISIDIRAEVSAPFVSQHVKQQCNYCSMPIDKPIWSGIFKIDEVVISLAGHLSTKSCDKVWELSRSLVSVVEVTKLPRSKFKIWEISKSSCDSIGLYFFPNKMRHDEDLDKLVKEVIEDDLVLKTVIGQAEMLIFPSTILPERYKTFQRKHYLWGVFRPRQDQCVTVAEPVHDTECRPQENEMEEQHTSNQQDKVQQVHWKSTSKSVQQAAANRGVPGSPDMGFQPEAPKERQLGDALCHTLHSAEAIAVATNSAAVTTGAAAVATNPAAVTTEAAALATNAAIRPAEAAENGTNAATMSGNHGRSDSIVGVPPGRYFCFVAGQTPKLEQLIQEMKREGSLVLAIQGEAIGGAGLFYGQATSPPLI